MLQRVEARFDHLVFSSNFDSGNCRRVEKVSDGEFMVWNASDCEGTAFETSYRTWFYFSVSGAKKNEEISITVMNMNKQPGLYNNDMRPITRSLPSQPRWDRTKTAVTYKTTSDAFQLKFRHVFEYDNELAFFAFCYPMSYTECQCRLFQYDKKFAHSFPTPGTEQFSGGAGRGVSEPRAFGQDPPPCDDIYWHRELLVHTLDGRRMDLITLSSWEGATEERVDTIAEGLFPPPSCRPPTGESASASGGGMDDDALAAAWRRHGRAHSFRGKRVVFCSARVHPGETPSSYLFEGILQFLLRRDDPRAAQLRSRFVFLLVPMLNPDGVARGHYRSDTLGVNLNRVYAAPSASSHPTVYAAKAVACHAASAHARCPPAIPFPTDDVGDGDDDGDDGLMGQVAVGRGGGVGGGGGAAGAGGGSSVGGGGDGSDSESSSHRGAPNGGNDGASGGLRMYLDLHAHASKRGCFLYGNQLPAMGRQVTNLAYARCVALNSAYMEFDACNFSEKNMKAKDKRDKGVSKEGSGRVAIYKATGITHSYTLEANYNCGRAQNRIPAAINDRDRASPEREPKSFGARFTPRVWMDVGKGCLLALLDLDNCNPWPRINRSAFHTLEGLRKRLFTKLKATPPYCAQARAARRGLGARKPRVMRRRRGKAAAGSALKAAAAVRAGVTAVVAPAATGTSSTARVMRPRGRTRGLAAAAAAAASATAASGPATDRVGGRAGRARGGGGGRAPRLLAGDVSATAAAAGGAVGVPRKRRGGGGGRKSAAAAASSAAANGGGGGGGGSGTRAVRRGRRRGAAAAAAAAAASADASVDASAVAGAGPMAAASILLSGRSRSGLLLPANSITGSGGGSGGSGRRSLVSTSLPPSPPPPRYGRPVIGGAGTGGGGGLVSAATVGTQLRSLGYVPSHGNNQQPPQARRRQRGSSRPNSGDGSSSRGGTAAPIDMSALSVSVAATSSASVAVATGSSSRHAAWSRRDEAHATSNAGSAAGGGGGAGGRRLVPPRAATRRSLVAAAGNTGIPLPRRYAPAVARQQRQQQRQQQHARKQGSRQARASASQTTVVVVAAAHSFEPSQEQ